MNTPNKLTILRVILVPVFMAFMMVEAPRPIYKAIGLAIFIIASITDWLDGYLARKNNLVTSFGKFMDPLADKMLTTAALLVLMDNGYVSPWVLMIVLTREFAVTGVRLAAVGEGKVIAASMWGKAKTVSQMIAIIVSFIIITFNIIGQERFYIIGALIWISTILTVISGIDYIWKNRNFIKVK